ncbi:MAG TPA: CHASE2 domain-containing protein, partial [Desertimonas sp.]|nr:CHASE2 domain-containing protein [Desertimonas sp.]
MRGFVRGLRRFGTGRIIAILLLVDFLIVRMWDPTPLEVLRHKVFDIYQVALPRVAQTDAVAIVDLDEASLKAYGQWPWPRTLVAELVTRLNGAGAAVIGFDVLFPEPDRTSPAAVAETAVGLDAPTREALRRLPDNDEVLAEAIRKARVVLGQSGFRTREIEPDGKAPPVQTGLVVVGDD